MGVGARICVCVCICVCVRVCVNILQCTTVQNNTQRSTHTNKTYTESRCSTCNNRPTVKCEAHMQSHKCVGILIPHINGQTVTHMYTCLLSSLTLQVTLLQSVTAHPTGLESTSIIVAYGLGQLVGTHMNSAY